MTVRGLGLPRPNRTGQAGREPRAKSALRGRCAAQSVVHSGTQCSATTRMVRYTQSKFGLSKGPRHVARERMCKVRKLPHLRPSPPLQSLKPIREQVTCPPKQVMSHQARENRTPYPSSNTKTVHPFPRAASRRACPPPCHAASTACLPAGAEDEVNAPVKRVHLVIRRVSMPANLFSSRLPFFSCGLVQGVTFFPSPQFLVCPGTPCFVWQANF